MASTDKRTGYPSIDKPWLKYYSQDGIDAELPQQTIYNVLYQNNKDNLDDIALIYFDKKISYKSLLENIDRVEKSMIALGVKKGDIVTIAMPNTPEVVYCIYALNKMRAVANLKHPLAGENEIVNYLNEVNTKFFIMFSGTYKIVKSSLNKTKVEKSVVVYPTETLGGIANLLYKTKELIKFDDSLLSWKEFIKRGKDIVVDSVAEADCKEISIMSHTGGTTGVPKCVMLSDYNINSVIWQIGETLPHGRQEIMLVCLPPFVNYSLTNGIIEPLTFGFQTVLIPEYDPKKFGEYIKKYKFNHINSIPAYWEVLLDCNDLNGVDMSCLNHILYGGDAMNPTIEERVNDLLLSRGAQRKIAKGYGSTELTSAVSITFDECNVRGSIGVPLPKMICKIINPETLEELPFDTEGEICFSGPSLMKGYYNNQEATDEIIKIHKDGKRWIHTGDLGYINESGVIFITGRIKRIMITKGSDGMITKLFPDRIERVIKKYPYVESCCVVGKKDEVRVNVAKAFVVLIPKCHGNEKVKQEIIDLCKQELPEYMWLEELEFRTDLPRTSRDKIDYKALEEMENKEK